MSRRPATAVGHYGWIQGVRFRLAFSSVERRAPGREPECAALCQRAEGAGWWPGGGSLMVHPANSESRGKRQMGGGGFSMFDGR